MSDVGADLRSYYEEEARLRLRQQHLRGSRVDLRDEFVVLLGAEERRSIVDFGAGPASDGTAFRAAGLRYVGLDLAHGNGLLAAEAGATVVQGSIVSPPFAARSFEAGWSMSTLMHLRAAEAEEAMAAMSRVLHPGSPIVVGLWGGDRRDYVDDSKIKGQRRLFSHRTLAENRALLASCGEVEREAVWHLGRADEEYQVFWIRSGL